MILLFFIIMIIIISMIRIVPQTKVYIIERLGKFHAEWGAGIHLKIPFFDQVVSKVNTKEQVLDFPPQNVITSDNVTMQIDSIVFMKVVDAKLYTYGVEDAIMGIENLAATTLRNLVGALSFDETLTSRDVINTKMEQALDTATDAWGIKVTRVEVKNITPPKEIQEVMTKQMKAEREKRQAILEAEGYKQASITHAEGDKQAKILAAEAERDAQIALAEGRAKSIRMVYEAEAEGLQSIKNAQIDNNVIKLKSLEALKDVADGNATKIFIPSDIANTVSSFGVIGESLGVGNATPISPKAMPKQQGISHTQVGSSHIMNEALENSHATQQMIQKKIYERSRAKDSDERVDA